MNKTIIAKGIDVSRWNGTIDWKRVRAAGINFALVRLGYCGYGGGITRDPMYKANLRGAIEAGLEVGIYLFSYARTAAAARIAAAQTLELIREYRLTYPVVFDIEDSPALLYSAMTREENTAIVNAYLSAIREGGYLGMVYASKSFLENHLTMGAVPYEVWVAQWGTSCGYAGEYGIWQYTETGKVDGISGYVDLNHCYREYPAIIAGGGWNHLEEAGTVTDAVEGAEPGGSAPSDEADDGETAIYTVVRNDTLTRIARIHGVPLPLLIKVNPQIRNPDLIYVGDVVRIPVREIA